MTNERHPMSTNTEALAVRLESGWCPIESPTDMERAAAELRRAERQLESIQLEARAIDAAMKGTQ